MINIVISGACGKMGRMMAALIAESDDARVIAGVDIMADSGGGAAFPLFKSCADVDMPADVIIDFTRPEALPGILHFAAKENVAVVLATTGFSDEDRALVSAYGKRIAIFQSANMSLGVNLGLDLVRRAAAFLGNRCDVEIIEAHHNEKADAPSGTALMFANAINETYLGEKTFNFGRTTATGKRTPKEIGIHAVRGGNVVGEHETLFFCDNEIVSIKHVAQSRRVFAVGALKAARFVAGKPARVYHMEDLLLEASGVTNLYAFRDIAMVSLDGVSSLAEVFAAVADRRINVDMISQTAPHGGMVSVSFTISQDDADAAVEVISMLGLKPECVVGLTKIIVEGMGMEQQAGISGRVFGILGGADVTARMITTSATRIEICIDSTAEKRATQALEAAFNI